MPADTLTNTVLTEPVAASRHGNTGHVTHTYWAAQEVCYTPNLCFV